MLTIQISQKLELLQKQLKQKIMIINIVSTEKIVHINNVPARVWEGKTENGIKVICFITRIAVSKDEKRLKEFEKDLQEHIAPSVEIDAIPLRLII